MISKNKAYLFSTMMGAMMMGGNIPYDSEPPRRSEPKPRPFGQPLPNGLKVFEAHVDSKEGMKCKFLVGALNKKNANKKFDKLFADLKKLVEEKSDNIMEEDITAIKRKHFKYADYEHVL